MVTALLVIFAVLVFLGVRRRRRKMMLGGLTATAPVFSVEPPARRHHRLDRESL